MNKIDWEDIAYNFGFDNDKDMLTQWHTVERLPLHVISNRIKVCVASISIHMKKIGVEVVRTKNSNIKYLPRLLGNK
jgi:hypothetical protein